MGDSAVESVESPRKKLWRKVAKICPKLNCKNEISGVKLLADGKVWMDMIPPEWKEIYGALYDEAQSFKIDETEKGKIDKDVHRTFGLFSRHVPTARAKLKINIAEYYESLHSVLMAASHERGYCQGINFLAAVFLLSDENQRNSFTLLCFLLRQRYLEILFNAKCSSLVEYMKFFEKKLRKHSKNVYDYFKLIGFGSVCYAIEWFTTCFVVTCPGDLSACVLDMLFAGFDNIMIRTGLAIIELLEDQVLSSTLEDLQISFKSMVLGLDPLQVVSKALLIEIQPKHNMLEVKSVIGLIVRVDVF